MALILKCERCDIEELVTGYTTSSVCIKCGRDMVVVQTAPTGDVLSQDALAEIGAIVVNSAYLEATIETIILNLTKLSAEDFKLMLDGAMFEAKLSLLESVAKARLCPWQEERFNKLTKIIALIRNNNTDRNLAVHGIWAHWAGHVLKVALAPNEEVDQNKIAAVKHAKNDKIGKLGVQHAMKLADKIKSDHHDLWNFAEETWPQNLSLHGVSPVKSSPPT